MSNPRIAVAYLAPPGGAAAVAVGEQIARTLGAEYVVAAGDEPLAGGMDDGAERRPVMGLDHLARFEADGSVAQGEGGLGAPLRGPGEEGGGDIGVEGVGHFAAIAADRRSSQRKAAPPFAAAAAPLRAPGAM